MKKVISSVSALALAAPMAVLAEPTSCIVNAGTETYPQASGYSTPASIVLRTRVSVSKVATSAVETRKNVSASGPAAYFSSKAPGGVIIVR